MELYTLSCVNTPDSRGATGGLVSIKIFKTYDDAIAALRTVIESQDVLAFEKKITEVHPLKNRDSGEGSLMAEWEYEAGWGDGFDQYMIHRFEIFE